MLILNERKDMISLAHITFFSNRVYQNMLQQLHTKVGDINITLRGVIRGNCTT